MSQEVFTKALAMVSNFDDVANIGGGEPTIHPQFWSFLGQAIGECDSVWLATNGKETRTALALAGIARGSERIRVALSQDKWHEPIAPRVVSVFKEYKHEIRNVGKGQDPLAVGRAKAFSKRKGCVCNDRVILPNGDIRACGCPHAPIIGDVFNGISEKYRDILASDDFLYAECWTSYKNRKGKTWQNTTC